MYWDKHRLIDPAGRVVAAGGAAVCEDAFARIIERDGTPAGSGSYLLQCVPTPRREDDPRGPLTLPPYTVLGCDRDGWWRLDSSKVPTISGRARFMHEIPARQVCAPINR